MIDIFKRTSDQGDVEERRIISLLRGSNIEKSLLQESDGARVKKQTEALQKLEPLRRERDAELPALRVKREKAEREEAKALALASAATQEKISATDRLASRSWWFSYQEELILAAVKTLAPTCIDVVIFELRELETQARNSGRHEVRDSKTNKWTGAVTQKFVSNGKSVQRRVDAIRAARRAAEELKLQALPEPEISEILEKLKADLPAVDEYDDVTDLPMPDVGELRRTTL